MSNEATFVHKDSIVRTIWGNSDTVLFIFAGAAAEFALNKAVDWLYFTGKLPADPLGRLFSTVAYAHKILFAEEAQALAAIDMITAIHSAVEDKRKAQIPEWAYRDVLYMLIHYSIASYELLERKLTASEKEEVYKVFYRMGCRMGINGLPDSYATWRPDRLKHMLEDLVYSKYTPDLFVQYKKHLGAFRYYILLKVQTMLLPLHVKKLLRFNNDIIGPLTLSSYKLSRVFNLHKLVKSLLLPPAYKEQIAGLNRL